MRSASSPRALDIAGLGLIADPWLSAELGWLTERARWRTTKNDDDLSTADRLAVVDAEAPAAGLETAPARAPGDVTGPAVAGSVTGAAAVADDADACDVGTGDVATGGAAGGGATSAVGASLVLPAPGSAGAGSGPLRAAARPGRTESGSRYPWGSEAILTPRCT